MGRAINYGKLRNRRKDHSGLNVHDEDRMKMDEAMRLIKANETAAGVAHEAIILTPGRDQATMKGPAYDEEERQKRLKYARERKEEADQG